MVQMSSLWLRAILCGGLICAGIFLLSGNHPGRFVHYQRSVETSEYFFYLEITNRTFNNSLLDSTSDYYKSLKSEVEALMDTVYKCSSCYTKDTYDGATDMSFSNGSLVIAKMTLVYHTQSINPIVVKFLFINNIIANPSEDLHINLEYTRDVQTPVVATTTQAPPTTPMPTQTPVLNSTTVTAADPITSQSATVTTADPITSQSADPSLFTSRGATSSPEPVTQDPNNGNWTSTVSATTGPSISISSVTPWSNDTRGGSSTSNSGSVTSSSSHDATESSGLSNSSTSQSSHHTTKGSNISNISNSSTTSSPTHTATTSAGNNTKANPSHPPSNPSSLPSGTPAGHPVTEGGTSTTVHDTSDQSGGRKSTPQSGNQGRTTAGNGSGSSNPRPYWLDWVPGWGIALLVLAALSLLLLIILLIMLLVRWCCMKEKKRPLPVSDPYQPTAPSPAPSYKSHTPAPVMSADHPDKPKKNKMGMYVVNP